MPAGFLEVACDGWSSRGERGRAAPLSSPIVEGIYLPGSGELRRWCCRRQRCKGRTMADSASVGHGRLVQKQRGAGRIVRLVTIGTLVVPGNGGLP